MKKIGIFGGSFNPIHVGHLHIAECFYKTIELDNCYFVPCYLSPFKQDHSPEIETYHRKKMVEIAIQDFPNFSIDLYELQKEEISYTINTVHYFKEKFPDDELYLLLGSDTAITFPHWNGFKEISEITKICVAFRGDINAKEVEQKFLEFNINYIALDNEHIDISSSEIRNEIKIEQKLNIKLPPTVKDYIQLHNLYN